MTFNIFNQNPITVIAQIVNLPIYAITFWAKKKEDQLKWTIISCLFFAFGYGGINAWAGVIIAIFTAIVLLSVYIYRRTSKVSIFTPLIIMVAATTGTILLNIAFDNTWLAWFVAFAGVLNFYNYVFLQPNHIIPKILFLLSHTILVFYEIVNRVLLFALVDLVAFISIAVSLISVLQNQNQCKR